jgi:NDP-sugar pyrophosphorylase family protein
MAGSGTRTANEFYHPKPLIPVQGRPLFSWALEGLPLHKAIDLTIITSEEVANYQNFNYTLSTFLPKSIETHIVVLKNRTSGQAETIKLGSEKLNPDNGMLIFNCDTLISDNFPDDYYEWDGLLGTFKSDNPGMSYVEASGNRVLRTAEKEVISDKASTGLYYFKNREIFVESFNNIKHFSESYIAPMYNYLIAKDLRVGSFDTERVVPLGTAQEILNFDQG